MASFFSALVGSYADTSLQRRDAEQKREDDAKKAEMNALGVAIDSGRLSDEGFQAAVGRIEELTDTKSKKGAESPLRSVLTKLRGKVPPNQQYQPQTLNQTVAAQNAPGSPGATQAAIRGMAQAKPEGTKPGEVPVGSQAGIGKPRAFLTQAELQQQAIANKDMQSAAQTRQDIARANAVQKFAAGIPNQADRDVFLEQFKALPAAKPTREVVADAASPTGWSYIFSDQSNGMTIGTMSGAPPPAGEHSKQQTFTLPDGSVVPGNVAANDVYVDLQGKPLPDGSRPLAAASYYPKTSSGVTTSINPVTGATQTLPRSSTSGPSLPRPPHPAGAAPAKSGGASSGVRPSKPTGSVTVQPKSSTDYFGLPATDADKQRELAYAYKRLSSQDRQALEALDSGKAMLDQISQDIQQVGGQSSMLEQYALYKLGRPVDPVAERAIQTISLLRAQMPAAYLHGVRNTKFIDQIQAHLPAATDSPALIMQKIGTLNTLIPTVERSVWETAAPWVLKPGQSSPTGAVNQNDPLGVLQ